jgi:hypothetical protein
MTTRPAEDSSRDRFRSAAHPIEGNEATAAATPDPARAVALAQGYARRGWPVFPCRPGTKEPATRHGFHDASTDTDQIAAWWRSCPDANVAIATGAPGPDVLDVDQHGPAGNGYPALLRLKAAGLLDPAGQIVRTPHGGLHMYFAGSAQTSGRLPSRHLDFKSSGGYVLAPPSLVDDKQYQPLRETNASGTLSWPAVTTLLDPQPARSRNRTPSQHRDAGALTAWVERLREGNRNAGLFWAACRALEAGQTTWLDDIAAAASRTGLSEPEIARTIESARHASAPHPSRYLDHEAAR